MATAEIAIIAKVTFGSAARAAAARPRLASTDQTPAPVWKASASANGGGDQHVEQSDERG